MAEIEVFQRHIADVIVIRDLHLIGVGLYAGFTGFGIGHGSCAYPCFRPVTGFDHEILREDVLLLKQHFHRALHIRKRKLALVQRRENGDENIGIMFNRIEVKMVLVIVVCAFVVVQLVLQLRFHIAILRLGVKHRIVFAEVGREDDGLTGGREHCRARADTGCKQHKDHQSHTEPDEDLLVLGKELLDLISDLFTGCLSGLGGCRRCRLTAGFTGSGIFLLDG